MNKKNKFKFTKKNVIIKPSSLLDSVASTHHLFQGRF